MRPDERTGERLARLESLVRRQRERITELERRVDDTDADLAFEGSGTVTLTVGSTGLADGTTVVAEDVDSGTELEESDVGPGGELSLTLPASTHRVDLHTAEATDSPTDTDTVTSTDTPTDTPANGDDGDGPDDEDGGSNDDGPLGNGNDDEAVRPSVEIRNASVAPATVEAGDSVTATVVLRNDGTENVTRAVELQVDGNLEATRNVSVTGDANRTVTIDHTFDGPGQYALAVDNRTIDTVTVEKRSATGTVVVTMPSTESRTATATDRTATNGSAADQPQDTATDGSTTTGSGPEFGIAVAICVLLAATLLARR